MDIACQTCGTKVAIQSFVAAAQQPCGNCGQLLMGQLSSGKRTNRPAAYDNPFPAAHLESGSGGPSGIWTGMVLGIVAGVGIVALVAYAGPVIPHNVRGAILYSLTGVLLGLVLFPVIAVTSLISMIILPFSLEGIFGDAIWSRLARANNERRIGPLFVPFFVFVLLPMAACGWGGSKIRVIETPVVLGAGLGAIVLGAILGMIAGARFGTRRTAV